MNTIFYRERTVRGLGQIATATLLGCAQTSVVGYDKGRHRPHKPDVLARMEALFGLPAAVLMLPVNEKGDAVVHSAAIPADPTTESGAHSHARTT